MTLNSIWINSMLLNNILKAITLIFYGLISGITLAQPDRFGTIDEANRLIASGDCIAADIYARRNFQRPMIDTLLGMIQLDCKFDKRSAIEYFKMAAREKETIAIEMLSSLGENTAEFNSKNSGVVKIYRNDEPISVLPLPPSHLLSTLPQPRARPQPIIIIQPAFNAAACIQDGGGTYCPYYRR